MGRIVSERLSIIINITTTTTKKTRKRSAISLLIYRPDFLLDCLELFLTFND